MEDCLATRDSRKIIRIWDTDTHDLLADSIAPGSRKGLEPFPSADVLQFSPDGFLLVFQEDVSSLQVVDWRKQCTIPMNLTLQEPSRNDPRLSLISSIAVSYVGIPVFGKSWSNFTSTPFMRFENNDFRDNDVHFMTIKGDSHEIINNRFQEEASPLVMQASNSAEMTC